MVNRIAPIAELVGRAAESLERNVLPHVENHYARLQLRAVREMLLNLGTRVEWRHADIEAALTVLQAALLELTALEPGAGSAPAPAGRDVGAAQLAVRRGQLAQVIERVYSSDWPADRRAAALRVIWRVVRADFDAEAACIRTGMYS